MLTRKEDRINRKVILVKRETSIRKVAEAIGHSPAAVMFAINRAGQSRRMHEKIAGVLGVTLCEFWPELYGPGDVKISENSTPPAEFEKNLTETHA